MFQQEVLQDIFGKRKYAEIILQLQDEQKTLSELLSAVGGSASTLETRIAELIDAKLVCDEKQKFRPFRRIVRLTEKGKQLAKTFKILEEMMSKIKVERIESVSKAKWEWFLAMLHALGGKIRGSTRLQKLSFLLKERLNLDPESFYEFLPGKFGPFSADLLEDGNKIEKAGLIEISEEVFEPKKLLEDWVICRIYSLTTEGMEKAKEIFEKMPENVKVELTSLKPFNEMLLSDLIHYVYEKYPDACGSHRVI